MIQIGQNLNIMENISDMQENILTVTRRKMSFHKNAHTQNTSIMKYKSKENIKNGSIPVRYHS